MKKKYHYGWDENAQTVGRFIAVDDQSIKQQPLLLYADTASRFVNATQRSGEA